MANSNSTIPSQLGQAPDYLHEQLAAETGDKPLLEHIQAIIDMPAEAERNRSGWLQTQKGR